MPYVVQQEIIPLGGSDTVSKSSLYLDRGEDILQKNIIFYSFECHAFPLCKIIPHGKVRGLRDDASRLKAPFGEEGHVQEKGAFIVSMWTCVREEHVVDEAFMQEWDPIWCPINVEFEGVCYRDPAKK